MTYPIVIPLHHGGGKLGDNTELRYALRSLSTHFKDDYQLAIVGRVLPEWLTGIEHIPSSHGLKSALKDAANRFPDGFFWWYDDLVLLKDITGAEMKITPACQGWIRAQTNWAKQLNAIKERLEKEGYKAWDYSRPHGPYWFDKSMVDEAFADWPKMAGKLPFESWILSKRDWPRRFGAVKQYYGQFNAEPTAHSVYLNYDDKGNTPEMRAWLSSKFPQPCKFEITQAKLEVHTIRFGNEWWVDFCGRTLDTWCSKHLHKLRIWGSDDINPNYPTAKFCEVDMLREFLAGDSEWMLYVDADVYVSDHAPRMFDLPTEGGFVIHNDNIVRMNRDWWKWCQDRWGDLAKEACKGWRYKNAGVWACDRKAAGQMLAVIEEPYYAQVQEQHHWNWWICLAHSKGMHVHDLPAEWNSFTWRKEKAAFHHIAGRGKYRKVQELRQAGLIPIGDTKRERLIKSFDFEPYRFTMDGPSYMPMDEYHIDLLHLACSLDTGKSPSEKVAVEIGSFNGASTSALIEAVNKGWLSHLHIVELKPNATLRKVMAMCKYPEKLTLHTTPYWETNIGYADLVFIDGDHKWPAVGDTLCALTSGAPIICMHDSNSWPAIAGTWGAKLAADMLKNDTSRHYFEDKEKREGLSTHRGFLVSAIRDIDLTTLETHESTKYMFLAMPKCAGRSMKQFCDDNGVAFVESPRPFRPYTDMVQKNADTIPFTILRDPAERVLSGYQYLRSNTLNDGDDVDLHLIDGYQSANEFVLYGLHKASVESILFRPQADWLQGVSANLTVLWFPEFEIGLKKLIGRKVNVPHLNKTDRHREGLSDEALSYIRTLYADDYRLIKTTLGKDL